MKKLKFILSAFAILILIYLAAMAYRTFTVVSELTSFTTEHFIINYRGVYESEAHQVAEQLEENYQRIRTDLNDPEHDSIRVFIHATQSDFNQATGLLNSTANGTSRGPNVFHMRWTNWFNSILPDDPIKTAIHEFTHCVQLNILIKQALHELNDQDKTQFDKLFEKKFLKDYPQWFWEAICDYEAGIVNGISVRYGMDKNLTLESLNNSNQIYNVGYTLIEYIVDKWGRDKLAPLIVSYVDIEGVLKVSETEFEKGWIEFVNKKY
jgi:hypothetical protein